MNIFSDSSEKISIYIFLSLIKDTYVYSQKGTGNDL